MKKFLAGIVIFVIVGVLFFPYFKHNNAPLPIDIPVGMYYPWLNESYGYAVRPPVKNSLISDTVSQFWIWRNWGISGFKESRVNIWNPYSFSGYEMSPWFHTILFSPLNLFYIFLSQIDAMSLIVISQVAISLLGGYLMAKLLFSSPLTGWAFAIGWTMSSYFVGWLTWGTISFGLAMIPWTIYFFEKYLSGKQKKISFFLCFISLIFLILSGHPQTIGYGLIIFYLWTVIRSIAHKQKTFSSFIYPLILIVFSLLITAPVIYPSLSIINNSIRSLESLSGVNFGFIPWSKHLITFLSVNFYGNPSTGNYFGGDYNFQEKLVNFGIIPLFLAVYQIIKIIRSRKIDSISIVGIFLIFLGLLLSTRYPVGFLIYKYKIPLLSTSPAGRSIIFTIFGSIVISCFGITDIIKKKIDTKSVLLSAIFFIFSFLFIYATLFGTLNFVNHASPHLTEYYKSIKDNFTISVRNTVFPLGFLILLLILIFISQKINKLKYLSVCAILLLIFLDGFTFFKKVTPFVPKDLFFPETPSIKFIENDATKSADLFRFERESGELLPPNMWEIYHFYSTSGYDPIAPLQYEKYMVAKDVHGGTSRYFENGSAIDKLNDLGVKYYMALKRNDISVPDKDGKIADSFNKKNWQLVFSEGPVVIMENQIYKPPYHFLEQEKSDTVTLTKKADNLWQFSTKSTKDNKFVLMENYSDHWQAFLDGNQVKIERYLGTFKQVLIPKGEHKLLFVYKNPDINTGIYLSISSLIFFVLFLFLVN